MDLVQDAFGENLKKYFSLPDYQNIMRGFVKKDDDEIGPEEQVGIIYVFTFKFIFLFFFNFFCFFQFYFYFLFHEEAFDFYIHGIKL